MKKIIKNGTLITATDTLKADILVEGEVICDVGQDITISDAEVIDATGMLVMPGGVDPHVHLELPMFGTVSSDDHYTGHRAAAFGGTTTCIDFISQDHATLAEDVAAWHDKADAKAAIDFSFHMNITRFDEQIAAELPTLPGNGISSIKVFTAYNNRLRLDDGGIFKVMRIAREAGLLTMVHAENGDVIDILVNEALAAGRTKPIDHALTRPAWGAVEAVLRASSLAASAMAPLYIVHMNVAGEVDQLEYARQHGIQVMGETCPQYLFFTDDQLGQTDGAKWVCSPPLRKNEDNVRLWQGIQNGTIQVIGTDHCPFFYNGSKSILFEGQAVAIPGKELGRGDFTKIPNGLPGIEDRLPVMWTHGVRTGRITPNQFVALNCTNPAKIFGLHPRKGTLTKGADADIAIWDPDKKVDYGVAVAHMRTDYNLYEGWKLTGMPVTVLLRGKVIVENGSWLGRRGEGKFIYRSTHNPIL
ncbi:MAG: dihydropyrimidinase [Anaerolinea sp.]|nr:dihydropyrimidinase [Anaerolinea sp.]